MGEILFICGTDTDVGKTRVAGELCAALAKRKIDFAFFKPFESGTVETRGGKISRPDTDYICKMSGGRVQEDEANLYAFREALAPGIAAARASVRIHWQPVIKTIQAAAQRHRLVIIEGAGGLLVPLAGKKNNLDLIRDLGARVLIVGRLGLGTINHTTLTYDRLLVEKLPVAGIILSQTTPASGIAEKTNPGVLKKMGLPVWGVLPYQKSGRKISPTIMMSWIKKLLG